MTLFLHMVCLLPLPAGELPLAKEANMNREKKPHKLGQYFELQGDLLFNRKVFSKIIQRNFDHPKPMIIDKVLVLHASRPWEHGLLQECESLHMELRTQ